MKHCTYPDCICPKGISSGSCNIGLPPGKHTPRPFQDCDTCDNGMAATRVIRKGRAHYVCAECGRDVTMVLIYIAEADNE